MTMRAIMIAALAVSLTPLAVLGNGQCTKQDFDEAQHVGFAFSDWKGLYNFYLKFKKCDDGGETSESYSEAVVRLLADHWDKLPEFVALSSKHVGFKKFVFRHIDATTSDDDLKKISQLSRVQCPGTDRALCAAIGSQAEAAIKESNEVLQK